MEDKVGETKDASFNAGTPPMKNKPAAGGDAFFTPTTADRIIQRLGRDLDELLEFKRVEGELAVSSVSMDEFESTKQALHDANALICDHRREISALRDENCRLKEENKLERDNLTKDYELRIFRIQQELEQKNGEIINLRKDKSDFDYKIFLLESRYSRKIEELTLALNQARSGVLNDPLTADELKNQLSAEIESLKNQLDMQITRGDKLNELLNETLENFREIRDQIGQFEFPDFSDAEITDQLPEIDLEINLPRLELISFEFEDFEDTLKSDELIEPARQTISHVMMWFRSVLDELSDEGEKWAERMAGDRKEFEREMDRLKLNGNLPDLGTTALEKFAKEFAQYLIDNEVFHPEDLPPADTTVFSFLLDRYLLLAETYHNAKTNFAERLTELEEQYAASALKTETLYSQISQLDLSSSTLCDTSATSNSFELSRDFYPIADASVCATLIADETRDPLEITADIPVTPSQRCQRSSLRTPQSRIPRKSFNNLQTPRIEEEPISIFKTPIQRLLSQEPTSTAKKSVTFKSPILARAEIEAENKKLETRIAEKTELILSLERSIADKIESVKILEIRVDQLEADRADIIELAEKLAKTEQSLNQITEKLIVEAVNLDPALEGRLRDQAPSFVLTVLLETVIARCQVAQNEQREAFEKDRAEWAARDAESAIVTEALQLKIDELTNQINKNVDKDVSDQSAVEEKIANLEESNKLLVSDYAAEIESLKLALDTTTAEKLLTDEKLLNLSNEHSILAGVLVSKETVIAELAKEIDQLKWRLSEADRKISAIESEFSTEKLNELRKEIVEKMETIRELDYQLSQQKRLITEIEDNRDKEIVEQVLLREKAVKELEEFKREHENIVSSVKSEFLTVIETLNATIADKVASFSEMSATIAELNQKLSQAVADDLKVDIENLKQKLTESLTAKTNTASRLAEVELQLTDALKDIEALHLENDLLKRSESEIAEKLRIADDTRNDFVEQLSACEIARTEMKQKLELLENEKQSLIAEKSAVAENLSTIVTLKQKIEEIEDEKRNLITNLENVSAEKSIIAEKLSAVEKVDTVLAERTEEFSDLKTELKCLKSQLENVTADKSAVVSKLLETETSLNNVKLDLEALTKENNDLTSNLESTIADMSAITAKLQEAESKCCDFLTQMTELQLKIEDLSAKSEIADLDKLAIAKKLAAAETIAGELEEKFKIVEADSENLRCQLTTNISAMSAITEKLATTESDCSDLRKQLESAQAEKQDLTSKLESTTADMSAVTVKLQEAETKCSDFQTQMAELQQKIADLSAKTEIADLEKLAIAEKLATSETSSGEWEEKFRIMEADTENLRCQLTNNISAMSAITEKLATTESVCNDLRKQLENMQEENRVLHSKLAEAIAESSALADKLAATEAVSGETAQKCEILEDEKRNLSLLLNNKTAEITAIAEKLAAAESTSNEWEDKFKLLHEENKNLNTKLADTIAEMSAISGKMAAAGLSSLEWADKFKLLDEETKQLNTKLADAISEKSAIAAKLSAAELSAIGWAEKYELLHAENTDLKANLSESIAGLSAVAEELSAANIALDSLKSEYENEKQQLIENFEKEKSAISEKLSAVIAASLKQELALATESLKTEKADLLSKLNDANSVIADLESQLTRFKSTESAILQKLACKQASDEAAIRLREELADLKTSWDGQQSELESLKKQTQLLTDDNSALKTSLAENRGLVQNLEDAASELNQHNTDLRNILSDIQQLLELPEDAVKNLTMDTNTKSRLRMFRDNVNRQLTGLVSDRQRLTIDVEQLTTEKMHFEIRAAELDAFGKSQEEQIHALSGKLARLEASVSKRPRRSDPIGPRRLEKLEEMNKTLHDLLISLITTLEIPNADKMRLISQREVEAASKTILDYAAKISEKIQNFTAQIKSLDQENQDLSDKIESLLTDNNQLELKLIEAQKKTGKTCKCAEIISELENKVKELDQENEEMSDNVEALLKDNCKLEMKILEFTNTGNTSKSCSSCGTLKKKLTELESLKTKSKDEAEELEKNLTTLRKKCDNLEENLKNKEQQLLRALNNLTTRPEEIRMCGSGSGLAKEISQSEKIRSLTKDNTLLKELLRQRAQTIKKLEMDLKERKITDEPFLTNSNSMDSPIRERKSLRTRGDVAAAYKRALRPEKLKGNVH